ncbi:MAG: amidohydrolase [Thermotogota bacterium]|nr:amidohydrolase [Thermotogota bacterium]HPY47728.1 amidohydrolase [Thermotogota bacterium]
MIIQNVTVLSGDKILINQDLFIKEGKIVKVSKHDPETQDSERIAFGDRRILAIPALVNAHTHTGMAFLRGVADDSSFEEWLFNHILPREDRLTPEDVYWGALFSQMEMARYGIALFNDMYMYPDRVCQAIADFGMKGCVCRGLVDQGGENGRAEENRRAFEKWHGYQNRIRVGFGPHAPYTCSDAYISRIVGIAKEVDTFVHIHIRESKRERELYTIESLARTGLFEVPCYMAHCVHLEEREIALMKGSKAIVLHNPSSNLKLANGVAPLSLFKEAGMPVILGTDSVASNNALDIWREMLLTALVQKGISGDPTVYPAKDAFRMATEYGYRYLGFPGSGSISAGSDADLALISMEDVNYHPFSFEGSDASAKIFSYLVYSAAAKDILGTMVNGRWVYLRRPERSGGDTFSPEDYPTVDARRVILEINRMSERINTD